MIAIYAVKQVKVICTNETIAHNFKMSRTFCLKESFAFVF